MRKTRILIIDSEPRWIEFAKNDLYSFEIIVATSIEQALAELEEDDFDLVIAGSNHIDVLPTIRDAHAEKRVIVTTVQPTTQEAIHVYRMGALRYFPKSFGKQDLLNRVREVVPSEPKGGGSSSGSTLRYL